MRRFIVVGSQLEIARAVAEISQVNILISATILPPEIHSVIIDEYPLPIPVKPPSKEEVRRKKAKENRQTALRTKSRIQSRPRSNGRQRC